MLGGGALIEFIIIGVILLAIFNIVYYLPNKLKEQEEKQSLYLKELYIRLNRLEGKLDKIIDSQDKNVR